RSGDCRFFWSRVWIGATGSRALARGADFGASLQRESESRQGGAHAPLDLEKGASGSLSRSLPRRRKEKVNPGVVATPGKEACRSGLRAERLAVRQPLELGRDGADQFESLVLLVGDLLELEERSQGIPADPQGAKDRHRLRHGLPQLL